MARVSFALLFLLVASRPAFTFESNDTFQPIGLKSIDGFKPIFMNDLPRFSDEVEQVVTKTGLVHCNGLVATINYEEFKKRSPDAHDESITLRAKETGFSKDLKVKLYRQQGKAPLAVTLLGFGQSCDDKIARAWQAYLYEAGCHVLSFDSLITNNMNECTGCGVAGNILEESRVVAKIIDAVLASEMKDQKEGTFASDVTSVRLLGTSYGGCLALECLRQPQASTWPIDRCLVLSIPINMGAAAQRLDKFSREDKPFFGKMSLMKLLHGFTPKHGLPDEKEEALMRAGLGYVFHGDLASLAQSNIKRYYPELPKKLDAWCSQPDQKQQQSDMLAACEARQHQEEKDLEAEYKDRTKDEYEKARDDMKARHKIQMNVCKRQPNDISEWTFQDYVFLLMKPYWKIKRGVNAPVTLENLLKGAPNFVQVFVAEDDPLNDPDELKSLRTRLAEPQLGIMPHGGHLGYTGTHWCESLVTEFFKSK